MSKPTPDDRAANALIDAKSPYLQQHAYNPVAWMEWGDAAFAEAKRRNVPVLVSIGYSTCHWCHVMAHESFENIDAAAQMNADFVCIKVDREELPEVDEIYMDAVQALTGHGGWPLNAFVDHSGRPFFAGTYFPTPQWRQLLTQLSHGWNTVRDEVDKAATRLTEHLHAMVQVPSTADGHSSVDDGLDPSVWTTLQTRLDASWDVANAGFSNQPKFPPGQLLGVLVERDGPGSEFGAAMAEQTLEAMQDGGIHDRVGGGFHRYSVDAQWRVPHFEKMLYDNAQLIAVYAMGSVRFDRPDFRQTAINGGDYLLRDMRVEVNGAFEGYASAEDADDPGGEGSFYAWSPDAIRAVVDSEAEALIAAWDLAPGQPQVGPTGHSEPVTRHIPHPRAAELTRLASNGDVHALRASWETHLPKLRAVRARRPRPHRDDKVLTDLNGLTLRAFARLGRHTREPRFLEATQELAETLRRRHPASGLERMPGQAAFITDYGHLLVGLLEAYDLLGDPTLVTRAIRVADEAIARLQADDGGFYTTPIGRDDLIRRSRERGDSAYPSGQHALAWGFTRLHALTEAPRFEMAATGIVRVQSALALQAPNGLPTLLQAWLERERGPLTVVVAGPTEDPVTQALLQTARASTLPALHIIPTAGHDDETWPLLESRRDLSPQALVCQGKTCLLPATDSDALVQRLQTLTCR
ncbi:MAG: hypothetical protein ACI9MR_000548 [Myxococcota bacterium]|jgi:uncharacterized protein YyaL (SSP411 family)